MPVRSHAKILAVAGTVLIATVAILCGCRGSSASATASQSNVVLVIVDTLGAQQLAPFGGTTPAKTPFLAKLAAESAVFRHAYSSAPWTKPSIASVFTSQTPSEHGVQQIRSAMVPRVKMLAEHLKEAGYVTGGVVSHSLLKPKSGYDRGFDWYKMVKFRGHVHDSITSSQVTDMGLEWLANVRETNPEAPYLLFLHYFDPHYNYRHHPDHDATSGYDGELDEKIEFGELRKIARDLKEKDIGFVRGLHHEEIAYTDAHLERLYNELGKAGHLKNTLFILMADHGEEFLEHGGIGHGSSLYDELVRVPFLFNAPGAISPAVFHDPVSTMDTLPTVLEWIGRPAMQGAAGHSLAPVLRGGAPAADVRDVIFEVDYHSHFVGLLAWPYKVITDHDGAVWQAYNLDTDPAEKQNIFDGESPELKAPVSRLKRYLETTVKSGPSGVPAAVPTQKMSEDEIKQLKSLGYLQ